MTFLQVDTDQMVMRLGIRIVSLSFGIYGQFPHRP